ncbi:MAG TPA: hypothetical protein VLT88_16030 [Desulfosarcina sp.]|nr:hypothetical protein [Desulfosarcina sp.]
METMRVPPQKMMLNLEKLNELNSQGYAGKFCLGDTVVLACGGWEGGPRWIHENEAVFDRTTNAYIERKCYDARKIND